MAVIHSEIERAIWRNCLDFARDVVAPRADDVDRSAGYPHDVFEAMAKAELLALCLPEEYGGVGGGMVALTLAIEAVARYCSSSGLMLLLTRLAGGPIMLSDNDSMKRRFLPALASGAARGSFCLTEPEAGSDALKIRTAATMHGAEYCINGAKCYISGATEADFYVVWALTEREDGSREPCAYLVERAWPGVTVGAVDEKMGVRGIPTAEVVFSDCVVPASHRLSRPGRGTAHLMASLNSARPGVAARGVGLAEGALSYAVAYSRDRTAFDSALIDLAVIQQMLADMAMGVEAAALLVRQAADAVDQGKVGKEGAGTIAMAKCFATDVAVTVASDSLQVMGAAGYMRNQPVERFYRDAKQLQIVEGTNQIQRIIIARSIRDGHLRFDN